jgi:taurine dioxygenase
MNLRRLAAPLGAVIEDLDVKSITQSDWEALNKLFCQYHVLVFPNQSLAPADHMAFAKHWGELVKFPYGGLENYPDIIELRNRGKRSDVNQHWHTDMSYNQAPPKLTMLYAHAAPPFGGDTAFANQHLAYQELTPAFKETINNLKAVHSAAGLARL